MSACKSTVYITEMELPVIRDPVPVYAHCFISDGAAEITEDIQSTTTFTMGNFTLNHDHNIMGIDMSVTNDGQKINSCNLHAKTGYIVALTTTIISLILFGYVLMDKIYSKRQTCS